MGLRLDDIAMAVAEPISRRGALRVAGAAAVTTFFGVRTGTAKADCPTCPRSVDPPTYSQRCSVARGVGCIFVCCPQTYTCCTTDLGVVCCREGYGCGPVNQFGQPTCKCANSCGSGCCKPGETCADPATGLCCQIPCGETCCKSGQKCADPRRGVCCQEFEQGCIGKNTTLCCDATFGTCCAGSVATQCCGYGQKCSADGACKCQPGHRKECVDTCCTKNQKCCTGVKGKNFCVPKQWGCCGDDYTMPGEACCAGRFPYSPASQRCCGISGVCPQLTECCPDGCCPQGSSCCEGGCCAADGTRFTPLQPLQRRRDPRRALRDYELRADQRAARRRRR